MASRPKLSGLQRQVLRLYREFLRAARLKEPEERLRIESIVSAEFRQNAMNVDRKNFLYIEYLLRRGKKQLEQLKSPDTLRLSTLEVLVFVPDGLVGTKFIPIVCPSGRVSSMRLGPGASPGFPSSTPMCLAREKIPFNSYSIEERLSELLHREVEQRLAKAWKKLPRMRRRHRAVEAWDPRLSLALPRTRRRCKAAEA
ncbi:hypothetical protein B296_00031576 [Ensete ventricosum]|uniref:Complex 1 LYR protein domain-containing protein n=1 Tax=Ensete ventricosum TaxID=4639 RepID=A0A426YRS5_ENSVE|nr:hypothetical protein B296_00031576 [Ensete ventricosum]